MENTFLENDRIFVNKIGKHFTEIHRGDVVVFHDPADWLNSPEPPAKENLGDWIRAGLEFIGLAPVSSSDELIKRVIGVGGDTVECCDDQGRILVNGIALDETEYLYPGDAPSRFPFKVQVPADHLWVMGDHRGASADSREHMGSPGGGFVPEENVVGKTFMIVWPFDRLQLLDRPETFLQPGLAER